VVFCFLDPGLEKAEGVPSLPSYGGQIPHVQPQYPAYEGPPGEPGGGVDHWGLHPLWRKGGPSPFLSPLPANCRFSGRPFYVRMLSAITGFPSHWDLLMLALAESSASVERLVVAHLEALVVELWKSFHNLQPPSMAHLVASFRNYFPSLWLYF
jgi:hypothetical protein